MSNMLLFGMGYAASRLAERLLARGWDVGGATRDGRTGTIPFANKDLVLERLRSSTHILSAGPPDGPLDPVLASYGHQHALTQAARAPKPQREGKMVSDSGDP